MFESLESRQLYSVSAPTLTPDQTIQPATEQTIVADCRKAGSVQPTYIRNTLTTGQ